ncbi:Hypothetical predicted protein [Prunus dulcis]|uniref:Uncharacterized protein n=1 Tax=Prunus dulcis TaxID=3755 RepID=A0A5E4GKF3_PRUDU|nr:Hypothetical predicted protein [Prunus dulcis]VVA40309.1 Hypothetical predicted protein [Prunus dulcis]
MKLLSISWAASLLEGLKHIRDQLSAAGIYLLDDDIIISALNGSTTYVYGSSSQTSSSSNVVPSPTVGHISAQPHTTLVLGFAGFKTPPFAPNYGSSSFIQS